MKNASRLDEVAQPEGHTNVTEERIAATPQQQRGAALQVRSQEESRSQETSGRAQQVDAFGDGHGLLIRNAAAKSMMLGGAKLATQRSTTAGVRR